MDVYQRENPLFSVCGLNCGLCPRHHTQGTSRCPGCGGEGFFSQRPSCGVISCARKQGIEFCYACAKYPCEKLQKGQCFDSFITHRSMLEDLNRAKEGGMAAYMETLLAKKSILETLLENYNDGRRKGFYCAAVNLLPLATLREAMAWGERDLAGETRTKERAAEMTACLQRMAQEAGISLALRKKNA